MMSLVPTTPARLRQLATAGALAIALSGTIAASPQDTGQAAPAAAAAFDNAKTWLGHAQQIEEYLRTAPVVRTENIGRGVTRPRRAYFAPGGLVESMVWKPLEPGRTRGFFESYRSEIAAYEIDKLLALDMVPPKVERRMDGETGVAIMWVEPTKSFADYGGVPRAPAAQAERWNRQVVEAKMFQNLIGDIDPNLGNWLVDPAWNLILVDHSRALTGTKDLVHDMQSIDRPLWTRMTALTEPSLTTALSRWMSRDDIRAIFERRTKMRTQIDQMVRERGEARVYLP